MVKIGTTVKTKKRIKILILIVIAAKKYLTILSYIVDDLYSKRINSNQLNQR